MGLFANVAKGGAFKKIFPIAASGSIATASSSLGSEPTEALSATRLVDEPSHTPTEANTVEQSEGSAQFQDDVSTHNILSMNQGVDPPLYDNISPAFEEANKGPEHVEAEYISPTSLEETKDIVTSQGLAASLSSIRDPFKPGDINRETHDKLGWSHEFRDEGSTDNELAPGVHLQSDYSIEANLLIGSSLDTELNAQWDSDGVDMAAKARAMLGIEATSEATYNTNLSIEGVPYSLGSERSIKAKALAGAEAEGEASISASSDNVNAAVNGEGFVGAKGEYEANGSLLVNNDDFASVSSSGYAAVGVGADLGATGGYNDGSVEFGFNAGVALGVGAGYKFQGSVDLPGLVTHPEAALEGTLDDLQNTFTEDAINNVAQEAEEATTNAVVDIGDSLADAFGW